MPTTEINLSDANSEKLDALSRRTGKTKDDLLNEAVEHLPDESPSEAKAFEDWRAAMEQARGMWKDRDDLTDEFFQELRRDWDRRIPDDRR